MSSFYVLETTDFFNEKIYYAGSSHAAVPSKALQYSLEEGIAVAQRLNNGPRHYKVVRVEH